MAGHFRVSLLANELIKIIFNFAATIDLVPGRTSRRWTSPLFALAATCRPARDAWSSYWPSSAPAAECSLELRPDLIYLHGTQDLPTLRQFLSLMLTARVVGGGCHFSAEALRHVSTFAAVGEVYVGCWTFAKALLCTSEFVAGCPISSTPVQTSCSLRIVLDLRVADKRGLDEQEWAQVASSYSVSIRVHAQRNLGSGLCIQGIVLVPEPIACGTSSWNRMRFEANDRVWTSFSSAFLPWTSVAAAVTLGEDLHVGAIIAVEWDLERDLETDSSQTDLETDSSD